MSFHDGRQVAVNLVLGGVQAKAGRPARTYVHQLCEDTGCSPEDLPEAMNDREKWRERVRDIRASGTTCWWWWWKLVTIVEGDPKAHFLIATAPRCRGGRYSFPWIAPLYTWSFPYNCCGSLTHLTIMDSSHHYYYWEISLPERQINIGIIRTVRDFLPFLCNSIFLV